MENFEKAMEVFSFSQHQDAVTYLTMLERLGYTIEDAKTWIANKRKSFSKLGTSALVTLCPDCNNIMRAVAVNIDAKTQTGDPEDNSVWLCQYRKCMNAIYNKETIEELKERGN